MTLNYCEKVSAGVMKAWRAFATCSSCLIVIFDVFFSSFQVNLNLYQSEKEISNDGVRSY